MRVESVRIKIVWVLGQCLREYENNLFEFCVTLKKILAEKIFGRKNICGRSKYPHLISPKISNGCCHITLLLNSFEKDINLSKGSSM